MKALTARLYQCARCCRLVEICSCCDRGNIYCQDCASIAGLEKHRAANRRYQQTLQGRRNNAARQQRFREKLRREKAVLYAQPKKVTDEGSPIVLLSASFEAASTQDAKRAQVPPLIGKKHCHFCGYAVSSYLRQDFLRYSRGSIRQGSLFPDGP